MITREEGQLSAPQRQVSFSPDVLLYVDNKYGLKRRREMFYTSKELRTFGNEVNTQIRLARAIGDRVVKNLNRDCCYRGLELVADENSAYERRRRRHMGQLAVFMEQDRQYLEDGSVCPLDFDSMAHRYGNITNESKELARERGILYEETEKVSIVTTTLKTTTPKSTKTSVPRKPISGCPVAPNRRCSVGPSAA
jgi:transcriptional regulator of met regulon